MFVKKTHSIEDFVGIFDGYLDDKICNEAIQHYENQKKLNKTLKRSEYQSPDVTKYNDETLLLTGETLEIWQGALRTLMINFELALREYLKETQILSFCGVNDLNFTTVKIQKTKPGQVLAYTIYLNDVEEAGETEFLFQKKRVKPKTGRIAIWPAGFPYVHRGNPPLKEEKYIITSWMLAMPN